MSSQDSAPENDNHQRLSGEVEGDIRNGHPPPQRAQFDSSSSEFLTASMTAFNDLSNDVDDYFLQGQRASGHAVPPYPSQANVQPIQGSQWSLEQGDASDIEYTQEEQQELQDRTRVRDNAQDELNLAQATLDTYQRRLDRRVQSSRASRQSNIPSALGKRSNDQRENDENEDGFSQAGPRTRRRANPSRAEIPISAGNAAHDLRNRRPNHSHPSSTIRSGLHRGASQFASSTINFTPQQAQLPDYGSSAVETNGENLLGLNYNYGLTSMKRPTNSGQVSNGGTINPGNFHLPGSSSTTISARQPQATGGHTSHTNSTTRKRGRDESETADQVFGNDDDDASTEAHTDVLGMPPTKRQKKRDAMVADGKSIPKDDEKEQGVLEFDGDGYRCIRYQGNLMRVAYHHERRNSLFAQEARKGRYTYPPKHGIHPDDTMAFHPDYVNVNMDTREGRPHLLYQWDPPGVLTTMAHPGHMRDPLDDMLLIDRNNHLIIDWPQLPKTISGQIGGDWLEYFWRLNSSIRIEDVLARCPLTTQKTSSSSDHELPSRSAFGNARSKQRLAIGTITWEKKEGSKEIRDRYERIMPNKVVAELAHRNTTTWFRDLSPKETDAICSINRGKGSAPLRAGRKKLDPAESQARKVKKDLLSDSIFHRLLREKAATDRAQPQWAQRGGPDPGPRFADSANNAMQPNAANAGGFGQPFNQMAASTNNPGDDSAFFGDEESTFVNQPEPNLLNEDGTFRDFQVPPNDGYTEEYMTADNTKYLQDFNSRDATAAKEEEIPSTDGPLPYGYYAAGSMQHAHQPQTQSGDVRVLNGNAWVTPMSSQALDPGLGQNIDIPHVKNEFDDLFEDSAVSEAADTTERSLQEEFEEAGVFNDGLFPQDFSGPDDDEDEDERQKKKKSGEAQ
ncbi:MAG: hypothetical protein Q9168_003605 [Polycauliona sp. 1 TL-2023]